ncbi:MAG: 6,7-dimethyl-8-ribityllumazine synthase, partial [Flavobacteriales bacterium]|nr:6,7-dimethyl-8-ribityllumazine synthase [Flavobacteriales bacterium]
QDSNIKTLKVPGSYELPLGAQWAIEKHELDAVICVGSVIRGETAHFDYVCQAVSQGVKDVSLEYNLPVIFGVLTDDNIEQSRARSGGEHGNKGTEAALTALEMLALRDSL